MESALERLATGARVAVIRLRSLGDCVLTTPALRLLNEHRPDLRIGVVVEPRFRAVFENNPAVQDILAPTVLAVARWKADLALNLHGGTTSIALTVGARARLRAGFSHFRSQAIYNIRIPRAQEILGEERKVHTAEHVASAMFHLGVPRQEIPRGELYAPAARRDRPYGVLHPFASHAEKSWPVDRFVAIARRLEQAGIEPLVLCGPGEANPLAKVASIGELPLEGAISLIRGATLFVGNDSGPAHVAAACGTPLIALFGGSDAVIWAPWKAHAVQIVRDRIGDITVEDVAAAVETLKVTA